MESAQFSKEGLQLLHEALARYMAEGERPGLVALLSKNGETHVDAIGTHEFEGGTPMRRDTIFRIASITKPITGAVIERIAILWYGESEVYVDVPPREGPLDWICVDGLEP
jgi:CubicO group peptidase (beta-lactamase class C family)